MTEQTSQPAAPQTARPGVSPPLVVLGILLLAAVLCCTFFSYRTNRAVAEIIQQEGLSNGETREDDVKIMDEYWIRSTLPISDAYRSGDDSALDDRQKETLEMASAVLEEIVTEDMTPYEKELAVYDWMTGALRYDAGVLQVIPQTQEGSDDPYGVLKYRNAVCVGYATTFRLFMQMMDIPCMVVHNPDAYHSWDLVQLEDDWYHVDIYSDEGSGNYANFNMNDEQCARGHDWDRDFFPAAEGLTYSYAVRNAQTVEDVYGIPAMIRDAMDREEGALFLDFPVIDEPHAQIVETMLQGVRDCAGESEDYGMLWMDWSWTRVSGTEYVLAVYISGYDEDGTSYDIPEEAQAKIDEALESVFGSAPNWEEVEEESAAEEAAG